MDQPAEAGDTAVSEVFDNLQSAAFTLERVSASHSRVIVAPTVSLMTRPPFMVATYHEGLTCRFLETVDAIVTVFKARQFAAAITLTQSVISIAAAMLELYSKADTAVRRADLHELDDFLHRIYESRHEEHSAWLSDTVSIGAFIQHVHSAFPAFRSECAALFELDRPEWFGTGRLYAGAETGECSMAFRRRLSSLDRPVLVMSSVLKLSTLAYEHLDRKLVELMPRLRDLDEPRRSAKAATSDSERPSPETGLRGALAWARHTRD